MKFQENHLLHFILICILIVFLTSGIFYKQSLLDQESRNTNRIASARLIVLAIENYQKNFKEYPSTLADIKDFLSPVPSDPQTGKLFPYEKTKTGYIFTIPQEGAETIKFQK